MDVRGGRARARLMRGFRNRGHLTATKDEVLSDVYPLTVVDDIVYEVQAEVRVVRSDPAHGSQPARSLAQPLPRPTPCPALPPALPCPALPAAVLVLTRAGLGSARTSTQMIKVNDKVQIDIGANPSEEEENEEYAEGTRTVNNIVEAFRLQETSFDKKGYMVYIKDYMKKVSKYLETKNPDRVAAFQKSAQAYVKKILADFENYQFFTGENMDIDGLIVLLTWRNDKPIMIYFKDALEEMKV